MVRLQSFRGRYKQIPKQVWEVLGRCFSPHTQRHRALALVRWGNFGLIIYKSQILGVWRAIFEEAEIGSRIPTTLKSDEICSVREWPTLRKFLNIFNIVEASKPREKVTIPNSTPSLRILERIRWTEVVKSCFWRETSKFVWWRSIDGGRILYSRNPAVRCAAEINNALKPVYTQNWNV